MVRYTLQLGKCSTKVMKKFSVIGKTKKVKNQFVMNIGDEGVIFTHFEGGKLANRMFLENVNVGDVKIVEKLFNTYPKSPIYLLVDVLDQTYSQQLLPPVSKFGVKQQVNRRLKRDFQVTDFNNVMPLGRSTEGRKDWNYLFISLANTEPFSKWLEFVLNQKNYYGGVYLLPVESIGLIKDLKIGEVSTKKNEWEILVLHNKTGGFRITAFRNEKLVLTRLAQNMVGENIPEVIVGNMEQEISNTVEYLKRLAFKGEAESRITIIAASEVLQKIDPKVLKFSQVEVLTPAQASSRLRLPTAVQEADKFADVLTATHFASRFRHNLKFSSEATKKIHLLYDSVKGAYAFAALAILSFIIFVVSESFSISDKSEALNSAEIQFKESQAKLNNIKKKRDELPSDINRMLDIMTISKLLDKDKHKAIDVIRRISSAFGTEFFVKNIDFATDEIKFSTANPNSNSQQPSPPTPSGASPNAASKNDKFEMTLAVDIVIKESDQEKIEDISAKFLEEVRSHIKEYKVEFTEKPAAANNSKFEDINEKAPNAPVFVRTITIPAKIKITGDKVEG